MVLIITGSVSCKDYVCLGKNDYPQIGRLLGEALLLKGDINVENVILFGHSLGCHALGITATYIKTNHPRGKQVRELISKL